MENMITAVNFDDQPIGIVSKEEAHKNGILHRAFSIVLYNKNNILIQQRALLKYHCGGLWTNTCCSHPFNGEALKDAVPRRLKEELNISCHTVEKYSFIYYYKFENGLIEYEFDHVFLGKYRGEWTINQDEVHDAKWCNIDKLRKLMLSTPYLFTPWFIQMFPYIYSYVKTCERRENYGN